MYKRMPLGLKSAPVTFKQEHDITRRRVQCQICLLYLNVVIVLSRTHEKHIEHLDGVLLEVWRTWIPLKREKELIGLSPLNCLDHLVSPGELAMAKGSIEVIQELKFPAA